MKHTPHITVTNITHKYNISRHRIVSAIEHLSITVNHGTFTAIIGPSGGGKTTLLKIMGGLLTPTSGEVTIDGIAPSAAQDQKGIGYIFQDPSLLPWQTVLGNVTLPLRVNRKEIDSNDYEAHRLLDTVGLSDFRKLYPHQLSSGMKQRVALARALVANPSLLLMDEPLGALDELTRSKMRYELLRIWEGSGKTVVLVTHSITEAVMMADSVAIMSSRPGHIVQQVDIDLPRPRDGTIEKSPRFLDYSEQLRNILSSEAEFDPPVTGR